MYVPNTQELDGSIHAVCPFESSTQPFTVRVRAFVQFVGEQYLLSIVFGKESNLSYGRVILRRREVKMELL
jgi:hypothetical protein